MVENKYKLHKYFEILSLRCNNLHEELLLGEVDLHGGGRGDLEALQGVPGGGGLHLRLKLHEGNVVTPGNQTNLNNKTNINLSMMLQLLTLTSLKPGN